MPQVYSRVAETSIADQNLWLVGVQTPAASQPQGRRRAGGHDAAMAAAPAADMLAVTDGVRQYTSQRHHSLELRRCQLFEYRAITT